MTVTVEELPGELRIGMNAPGGTIDPADEAALEALHKLVVGSKGITFDTDPDGMILYHRDPKLLQRVKAVVQESGAQCVVLPLHCNGCTNPLLRASIS